MKLPVHRIIPFSNVEGLGNRTSIFVQGCNLNCVYCHNSETIPLHSDAAQLFTVQELLDKIKENMPFIRGITISGGEPTIYYSFLAELFKEVRKLGLTSYIDTNGFFNLNTLQALIFETDKFLYDIKGIGPELQELCFSNVLNDKGKSSKIKIEEKHLMNLEHLLSLDKVEEVRMVYLKGFYNEEKVIESIASLLVPYPHVPLKIIRVHTRGLEKEQILMLKGHIPSKNDVTKLIELAYSKGIHQINHIL